MGEGSRFYAFEALGLSILKLEYPVSILDNLDIKDCLPCHAPLAELYFLMGEQQKASSVLSGLPNALMQTSWGTSLKATGQYFEGDRKGAIQSFEDAVKIHKKETRKRKFFFPYLTGIFYILAMIQEDIDKYDRNIKQFLNAGSDINAELSFQGGTPVPYFSLYALFYKCQDALEEASPYQLSEDDLEGHAWEIILYVLYLLWGKQDKALKKLQKSNKWKKAQKNLEKYGFGAVLQVLNLALAKDKNALLAPPVPLYEEWQRALMRLEDMTGTGKKAAKTNAETRIAWLVTGDADYPNVQPKLQKKTKSGTWTKGRNIALKNLFGGGFSEAPLTEYDRKAIDTIEISYEYNGWGRGSSYYINDENALHALAGHPAVIAADGGYIEIVIESPDLIVKKDKKGGFALSFSGDIPAQPGRHITRQNLHRYEISEITQEQCNIALRIGKRLVVPKEGAKDLQALLPSLAPMVSLQSDLAGAGDKLETVPANSGLEVHLSPADTGFAAEFLIEPITGSEKFFHPGKGREHILAERGQKQVQTERNLKQERATYNSITKKSDIFQDLEEEPFRFYANTPHQCLELLDALKSCDPETVSVKWPEGEKLKVGQQLQFKNLALSIKKSSTDWFALSGKVQVDQKDLLTMEQLLVLVGQSNSRFLKIGEEGYMALEQSLFRQLKQISGIAEKGKIHSLAASALQGLQEKTLQNKGKLRSDKFWKAHKNEWEISFEKEYPLPSTLQADLRDYQQVGFEWLARLSGLNLGACLADDMGLGKTLQALAVMLTRAAQGPSLVVAPVSVVPNWQSEIEKFAPTLNVIWMIGSAAKRKKMLENLQPFDVVLCSYGILAPDEKNLTAVKWDMVVLDEAQAIKNHLTKRAKAAFNLQANFRLVTTGTPMENHLGELWSIFRFVTPGFLGSYDSFTQRFISPIEHDTTQADDLGLENTVGQAKKQHLKALIQPFILRRKKTQVLKELPAKTEITLSIEMSRQERAFYEALRQQAVSNIEEAGEETGASHVKILAEIMRLRRSCCHPKLVDDKIEIESSKLQHLQELLLDLKSNNHKVLIFSQFVGHLALIKDLLDKNDISYQYLDGSTPVKKRQQAVQAFQNGEGDCFLISLKAGGSGLNLTAANYVIHMDPWWNPAVEDQASDRAHRIGQKQPVTIYRLVVADTIEEKILSLHKTKRDLADSLLEGTDQTGKISTKELMSLLQS